MGDLPYQQGRRVIICILVFILISFHVQASVLYVDANGLNTTGSSWQNAYNFLSDALAAAREGDELRVSQGTYLPDQTTDSPEGMQDRKVSFQLKSGLTLRGGYAGLQNPSDPNEFDPAKYPTVLNGNDYFFRVLKAEDCTSRILLEGITVSSAYENSVEIYDGKGLYCRNSQLFIKNCIFKFNPGSSIYCSDSDIIVEKCQFICNGSFNFDDTNVHISDSLFKDNRVHAIYGYCREFDDAVFIYNCIFFQNYSALYVQTSQLDVINCTFTGNLHNDLVSTNYAISESAYCNIANCVFWNNLSNEDAQLGFNGYDDLGLYDVRIHHTIIQGGRDAVWTGENIRSFDWDPSNIDSDPLLTWDGHIQSQSPCIDNGDPNLSLITGSIDCDGETRVLNGRIDIGADEFLDMDEDHLADWWELQYFEDINLYDANDNPDQDDLKNSVEYAEGTHPLHKKSDYYIDPDNGNDAWDGLAAVWDGQHGPKATIQNAIDESGFRDGDRIFLLEGVYQGTGNRDIDFNGKQIYLSGTNPNDPETVANTVIDCQGDPNEHHRGFIFQSYEKDESVIDGITISNGYAEYGGGICCLFLTSPTVKRCIIRDNYAEYGGGMYGGNGNIINCQFLNNSALVGGGLSEFSGIVMNSRFLYNSCTETGGAIDELRGSIVNSLISYNTAYKYAGLTFRDAIVQNCTITNNQSEYAPAGLVAFHYNSQNPPEILNSIIWGNTAQNLYYPTQHTQVTIGSKQAAYCCIQDLTEYFEGEGNISDDPQLVDQYHLSKTSPCLDAGNNEYLISDTTDLDNDGDVDEEVPYDLDGNQRRFDSPHMQDTGNGDKPIVDIGCHEVLAQGIYIDEYQKQVEESSDCTFSVRLALNPSQSTQVDIRKMSGADNIILDSPETLYFDSTNFSEAQPVTIRADEDNDYVDMNAEFELKLTDQHTISISVDEVDNDPDPDFNDDGRIDNEDLYTLISAWLQSDALIDIMPVGGDGIINIVDFAELARLWIPASLYRFSDDFETGDFSQNNWQHAGDAAWQMDTEVVYEGQYAAKSGQITHDQSSELTLEVETSSDQISFYFKVSSESDYDYLRFYIDGTLQNQWSGQVDWTQQTYPISSGIHTFQWIYEKDYVVSSGMDCAWIDKIQFQSLSDAAQ